MCVIMGAAIGFATSTWAITGSTDIELLTGQMERMIVATTTLIFGCLGFVFDVWSSKE